LTKSEFWFLLRFKFQSHVVKLIDHFSVTLLDALIMWFLGNLEDVVVGVHQYVHIRKNKLLVNQGFYFFSCSL
jgi:hypothetical protein